MNRNRNQNLDQNNHIPITRSAAIAEMQKLEEETTSEEDDLLVELSMSPKKFVGNEGTKNIYLKKKVPKAGRREIIT